MALCRENTGNPKSQSIQYKPNVVSGILQCAPEIYVHQKNVDVNLEKNTSATESQIMKMKWYFAKY